MKICEFKPISIDDIPAMADLLIHRQSFEGEVFPFLKTVVLMLNMQRIYLENCLLIIRSLG